MRILIRSAMTLVVVTALLAAPSAAGAAPSEGPGDATVVAVIDFGFVPYHWDMLGALMPQHLDADPSNDLPLRDAPDTWLPGFPSRDSFASFDRLDIRLAAGRGVRVGPLDAADAALWDGVQPSGPGDLHYYWMPGTKVIGAIDFAGNKIHGTPESHGTGVTSVSVGTIHGTCPECLLVFLNVSDEESIRAAIDWATSQPWIDVVTNSYGLNTVGTTTGRIAKALPPLPEPPRQTPDLPSVRDQVYAGPGMQDKAPASERGQTTFFSAGNGIENGFITPHSTYTSSVKGPDWVVTVGAISPDQGSSYTGAGKPVDVAGIGSGYPSAYTATTAGGTGDTGFSGTSNAAPTIAGTYARALYLARRDLAGPSRAQSDGVVAVGAPYACGDARPDCELGDGVLTADELRTRLFEGAVHTPSGMTVGGIGNLPPVGEDEFLNEGHGSYKARLSKDVPTWLAEFDRLLGPLEGRTAALERPAGERDWMTVDSACRQRLWGPWSGGYHRAGAPLPAPDPAFPVRSALAAACG